VYFTLKCHHTFGVNNTKSVAHSSWLTHSTVIAEGCLVTDFTVEVNNVTLDIIHHPLSMGYRLCQNEMK